MKKYFIILSTLLLAWFHGSLAEELEFVPEFVLPEGYQLPEQYDLWSEYDRYWVGNLGAFGNNPPPPSDPIGSELWLWSVPKKGL